MANFPDGLVRFIHCLEKTNFNSEDDYEMVLELQNKVNEAVVKSIDEIQKIRDNIKDNIHWGLDEIYSN